MMNGGPNTKTTVLKNLAHHPKKRSTIDSPHVGFLGGNKYDSEYYQNSNSIISMVDTSLPNINSIMGGGSISMLGNKTLA